MLAQRFARSRRQAQRRPDPHLIRAGETPARPAAHGIATLCDRGNADSRWHADLLLLECLVEMAERRGIEVYFEYCPELAQQGAIYAASNGSFLMWVNTKDPLEEVCDTVAHELGHWRMHRKDAPRAAFWLKVGRRAGLCRHDAREHQADRFAKTLVALVRRRLKLPTTF